MKKLILVLIAVLLCASFAEAYVIRSIGRVNPTRMPTGRLVGSFMEEGGIGGTAIKWHPNTIDTREATSTRPNTAGVLEVKVNRRASGSPPITEGVTIFVTAYYFDGNYENFGTENIEGIMPSNRLVFDHSPSVQAYTNDKAYAKGDINTQVKYVGLVVYNGQARILGLNLKVR